MKVFLINLDRRRDRLNAVDRQLESLDIEYERISAIDGSASSYSPPRILNSFLYSINYKKRPVFTEVACAQSHRLAWSRFLQSHSDYALILEDDVLLDPALLNFMNHDSYKNHFDVINLSSKDPYNVPMEMVRRFCQHGDVERPNLYHYSKRNKWCLMEWRKSWRIFKLHCYSDIVICECDPLPALASGYVISRRAAEWFLKTTENLYYPVDLVWRYSGGSLIEGFVVNPIIKQKGNDTDIVGRSGQPRLPVMYRIFRPILKSRRLKRRIDVLKLYGLLRH